jgi:hypothetical protein
LGNSGSGDVTVRLLAVNLQLGGRRRPRRAAVTLPTSRSSSARAGADPSRRLPVPGEDRKRHRGRRCRCRHHE